MSSGTPGECRHSAAPAPGARMHGHNPTEEDNDVSDASKDPADIAAALARLGSATVGESGGLAAHRRLRPAWSGAAVAAPAYPVGCTPGDNLAVHVGVTEAPRGDVLGRAVGPVPARGYWGEVLAT